MPLSFIQTCHELLGYQTFIIDEENNKFFCADEKSPEVFEIDHDPRPSLFDGLDEEDDDIGVEIYFDRPIPCDHLHELSGDSGHIDSIQQFIDSGCVPGNYPSRIEKPNVERVYDPAVIKFWEHYQKIGGKFINNLEEYDYYYGLFYTLTQNRVGSDCPIPSTIGFDMFGKIIKVMCKESGKRISGNREFSIFFRSIDEIYDYS